MEVIVVQRENFNYSLEDHSFYIGYKGKVGHYTMSSAHFHEHYEIYYLLDGERYYFINNKTFLIKRGDLVLINSNDLHKTIDVGGPSHKRALIYFHNDFISSNKNDYSDLLKKIFENGNHVIRLPSNEQDMVEALLNNMLDEASSKQTGYMLRLQSLLSELLVSTARFIETSVFSRFDYLSPVHRKVSEIVSFINQKYMEPLTLDILSENFFISKYHLSRIFKETTGFSFIEYLNSVRVRESQILLKDEKIKIIDIAQRVGYGSISHFGRVFKATTGMSPHEYRKRCSKCNKDTNKIK